MLADKAEEIVMVAKPTGELFQVSTKNGELVCDPIQRSEPTERAFDEDWLQSLLEQCPSLLPLADIDERVEIPLVSIGREVGTEAGAIDNLFVSSNGHVVVVETKLWRNAEARRTVVAQILDYAKHVRGMNYERLSKIAGCDLWEKVRPDEAEPDWIDRVNMNLSKGRMTLLVVGDGIHTEAEGLAETVREHPDFAFRLALVELRVYPQGEGRWFIVNSILAKTAEIERAIITIENRTKCDVTVKTPVAETATQGRGVLSEQVFREDLRLLSSGDIYANVAEKLLRAAESAGADGLSVEWRSKSFVIRAPDPSGSDRMLSLCVVTSTGVAYAYHGWLEDQLAGSYSDAAIERVRESQIAMWMKFGGIPTKGRNQINIKLKALADRERDFVDALAEFVSKIAIEFKRDK